MSDFNQIFLIFGATGQQGGSVAAALRETGHAVRALVRDPASPKALALRDAGVELVRGDFEDAASIASALTNVHGVFSVQPSSPGGTVSDEDEVRYGTMIADLAEQAGVQHLVYSSGAGVGAEPTGLGHFDSKARIEAHIKSLSIPSTVVRPVTFMEMLTMPGFGLDQGRFDFFARPDQTMQFLAVEDIGKFVAAIFADRSRFAGATLEIASDAVTGRELGDLFTNTAGYPITYGRFSDEVLASNPFLGKLAALVEEGRLAGHADLDVLRAINPAMLTLRAWLNGTGRDGFRHALGSSGTWDYNRD